MINSEHIIQHNVFYKRFTWPAATPNVLAPLVVLGRPWKEGKWIWLPLRPRTAQWPETRIRIDVIKQYPVDYEILWIDLYFFGKEHTEHFLHRKSWLSKWISAKGRFPELQCHRWGRVFRPPCTSCWALIHKLLPNQCTREGHKCSISKGVIWSQNMLNLDWQWQDDHKVVTNRISP